MIKWHNIFKGQADINVQMFENASRQLEICEYKVFLKTSFFFCFSRCNDFYNIFILSDIINQQDIKQSLLILRFLLSVIVQYLFVKYDVGIKNYSTLNTTSAYS